MADIPTNAYRVFTGPDGRKRLHYISPTGSVMPLAPKEAQRKLRDGYYTRDFKLLRLDEYPRAARALTFKQALTKYRPDQSRGEDGRWIDEGGGVSHGRTPVGLSPLRQEFEAVLGQKAGKTPATQLRRRLRSYYQQRIDQTRASLAVGKPDAAEQRRVRARVEELKRRLDMLDELSGKVVRAEHGGRLRDMAERMRITPSTTERDLLSHIDEIKNTKLTKKELQTLMRGMGMQARPKSYSASKLKADVLGSLRSALSLVRRLNATRGRSAA